MADWRYLRRWTEKELATALHETRTLRLNFDLGEEMTPEHGWDLVRSHALIAREPMGPPEVGGTFERLWSAIERFEHSDPRIVIAHYAAGAPLLQRRKLLELQALGFRYLCPAVIGAMRAETSDHSTSRGWALDTLEGHIERGREWFLLKKDHATGEVRFQIEAAWRPGDFPNFWSRLGFHLTGRRYQRAWHRLAHFRLRRIAAGFELPAWVGREGLVHEGAPIPAEPVQFFAQRGAGRSKVDVEEEREEMRRDRLWRALALGALSGVRSMTPPAMLAWELDVRGKNLISGKELRRPWGRRLMVLAASEILADKMPFIPPRTQLLPLAARMTSGAFAGVVTARKGESKYAPALLGAAAALATTFASFQLRQLASRSSRTAGTLVALAEDALALGGSAQLARTTARATR